MNITYGWIDISHLSSIQTIDNEKHASLLNKFSEETQKKEPLKIYIQVNTSGEKGIYIVYLFVYNKSTTLEKSGVCPSSLLKLAIYIINECPYLHWQGLMTIGSLANKAQANSNPDFKVII